MLFCKVRLSQLVPDGDVIVLHQRFQSPAAFGIKIGILGESSSTARAPSTLSCGSPASLETKAHGTKPHHRVGVVRNDAAGTGCWFYRIIFNTRIYPATERTGCKSHASLPHPVFYSTHRANTVISARAACVSVLVSTLGSTRHQEEGIQIAIRVQ